MQHKLIGTAVVLVRPVVVKSAHTTPKPGTENEVDFHEAEVEMEKCLAHVIGVDVHLKDDKSEFPNLHLAYFDPAKAHHIGGSDWQDAFARVDSVPPASRLYDFENNEFPEHKPYYETQDVRREMYRKQAGNRVPVAFENNQGGPAQPEQGLGAAGVGGGLAVGSSTHGDDKLSDAEVARVKAAQAIAAEQEAAKQKREQEAGQ